MLASSKLEYAEDGGAMRHAHGAALEPRACPADLAGGTGERGDGLDYDLDEPSRVVRFPMLLASGSGPAVAPWPAIDTNQASLDEGHHSKRQVALAALAVVVASATGLGFLALSHAGDRLDDTRGGEYLPGDFETLGYHHDRPGPAEPAEPSISPVGASARTAIFGRTSSPPESALTDTARAQPDRTAPNGPSTNTARAMDTRPLGPDEVQRMATKRQTGLVRCYERAKRKDPFLAVRSMRVVLAVAPRGNVVRVELSSHRDSVLGRCIEASIARWRFRASKGGITTEINLKFAS